MLSVDNSFPFDTLNGGKSLFISKNGNNSNNQHNSSQTIANNGMRAGGSGHMINAPSSSSKVKKIITDPSPLSTPPNHEGMSLNNTSNDLLMRYRSGNRINRQTPVRVRQEAIDSSNSQNNIPNTNSLNGTGLISYGYQNSHVPYALPKLNRNHSNKSTLNTANVVYNDGIPQQPLPSPLQSNPLPRINVTDIGTGNNYSMNNGNQLPLSLNNVLLNPSRSRQLLASTNVQNNRDSRERRRQSRQNGMTNGSNVPINYESGLGINANGINNNNLNLSLPHRNKQPTLPPAEPSPAMTQEISGDASVTSFKGLKPGRPEWINQDNYFIVKTNHGSEIFCVLDGHGEHGHHVSRKCRNDMPNLIISSHFDLKRAFSVMQQHLLESNEVSCIIYIYFMYFVCLFCMFILLFYDKLFFTLYI